MIKKFLFATFLITLISCKKTNDNNCAEPNFVAPASETAQLLSYVPNDAIQHPSGFYYTISPSGSMVKPTVCSTVSVKYTGSLLPSNFIFDNQPVAVKFLLGQLIVGWQKGLPLIGIGGTIVLYLPPSLAYGAVASGPIPANSYLKFIIELVDVQ
jgi:FKBP-type peptidyl-prolyl cis-trans isomerase FkpA